MPDLFRNILSTISTPFEDLTGKIRPLWRDISRYQMYWNHAVAVLHGILGVFVRAGISWGYHDPFFRVNYDGAEGLMYRSSYHVLYPGESVLKQADKVWYIEQPEIDTIPRCIDFEALKNVTYSQAGDACWEMSELVYSRDGIRPIIYSRYMLIEEYLRTWTPEMFAAHYWILAQYRYARWIEHAGPPTLPKYKFSGSAGPIGKPMIHSSNIILHQTADKKIPFPGEVPTPYAGKSIDYDRWELGTEEQMVQFIEGTWNGAPPPPPVPGQKRVRVNTYRLNLRNGPNSESADIGTLTEKSDVTILEQQGNWLRIKEGWIHKDYVVEF